MTFTVLELIGLIVTVAVGTTLVLALLVMFWPQGKGPRKVQPRSAGPRTDDLQALAIVSGVLSKESPSSCNDGFNSSDSGSCSSGSDSSDSSSGSSSCD